MSFFLLLMSLVFFGLGISRTQTERFKDTWPLFLMGLLRKPFLIQFSSQEAISRLLSS